MISKFCLDAKPYNEKYEPVTWETCTLRQWLNSEFINEAFSGAEKAIICDTYLQNTDNPKYGTNGGNDITDKVFLLSINEATRYFANDGDRKTTAMDYAKEQGIYVSVENGNSWWWLRSPGDNDKSAACVQSVGFVSYRGSACTASMRGVRPAMWVNIGE